MDPFRKIETHLDGRPIASLDDLRAHLQTAVALEHATIPPYLTALYSIRRNTNFEAAFTIRGVVMEEMLHMVLASNVLVALGGTPVFTSPGFVPHYPSRLPHAAKDLFAGLQKFSRASVEAFMVLEHPAPPGALPEADDYHSIGQFYQSIKNALCAPAIMEEISAYWCAHPPAATLPCQIGPAEFYGSGGTSMFVTDLTTALLAFDEIMHQGEGMSPLGGTLCHPPGGPVGGGPVVSGPVGGSIGDGGLPDGDPWHPAHYYCFEQMVLGRAYVPNDPPGAPSGVMLAIDWDAAANLRPNSRLADYRRVNSLAVPKMIEFNRTYRDMLVGLEARYRGDQATFAPAIGSMMQLRNLATELMNIPSGFGDGTMAAPSFEPQEE